MGHEKESDRCRYDRAECRGEYEWPPIGPAPCDKSLRVGRKRSIDNSRNSKASSATRAWRILATIRGSRYDVLSAVRTCELESHYASELS